MTLDRAARLELADRLLIEIGGTRASEVSRVDTGGHTGVDAPLDVAVLTETSAVVEHSLGGTAVRYVVFDGGVLQPTSAGLLVRWLAPGVSAREVQARFGVPMIADERLATLGAADDAS